MTPLVPITMFGWPLVVVCLFTLMPARRAVIVGMLGAWLFLPMAGYSLPGLPDITKMSLTCVGVFAGVLVFDSSRLSRMRFSWVDLAIVGWLLAPLPAAITSGYGPYEGLSGVMGQILGWGMPYLIGRMYFNDAEGLRELALGIAIGGLVYVPLVLFEARMSPQLHTWVYGFHQHVFAQSRRGGGWRPTVFMQHGLAVAMFMGTAALCGLWLWKAGRVRVICGVPAWAAALGLFAVAIACRSTYALMLMLVGALVLVVSRFGRTRVLLVALLLAAPLYVTARTVGGWDAGVLRQMAVELAGERRAESLAMRLDSEETLWRWVQGHTLFGHSRLWLMNEGSGVSGPFIPDGLWLIALGKFGFLGLVSMLGVLLLPAVVYLTRHRARDLFGVEMAGATVLMTVLVLYAMDNLLNACLNPIYLLAAGGLPAVRRGVGRAMPVRDTAVAERTVWASPPM